MYFDSDPGDDAAERMMYIQAVYDVVSARYPCNEEDCKTLAGLQLQVELGTKRLPDFEVRAVVRALTYRKVISSDEKMMNYARIRTLSENLSGNFVKPVMQRSFRNTFCSQNGYLSV